MLKNPQTLLFNSAIDSNSTQNHVQTSRIAGFSKMTSHNRLASLISHNVISSNESIVLENTGALTLEYAEKFIENCIGGFTLPLGIATNFIIDGEEILIPMAIEESSVIAAASYGAKLTRSTGGFISQPTKTIATCQIQFYTSPSSDISSLFTESVQKEILNIASSCHPRLILRGGGVRHLELRNLSKSGYYVLHINIDTCEAMGANIVNSIAEKVGSQLPLLLPCVVGAKILTNLAIHRVTKIKCEVEFSSLERDGYTGEEAAHRICSLWEFADLDPFRATTHNKGIMNGIDPVVICTGNDWRAVEAGCHAYASITGVYKPFSHWFINENKRLQGEITVPIAVGTVGGVTRLHPSAAACLKLLASPSAAKLSTIIASVGLAQNLSALRALACEGIQQGHMALHEKNLEILRHHEHKFNK